MTKAVLDELVALLERFAEDPTVLADLDEETRRRILVAAGQVSRPDRYKRKAFGKQLARNRKKAVRAADDAVLAETGIRALRREPVFVTPPLEAVRTPQLPAEALLEPAPEVPDSWDAAEARRAPRVSEARTCYVCKAEFHELHHFYDQMCARCAELNWRKRNQTADLSGRVAIVTGGRVKIGYQAAIKMLRAGAHTVVITRFPRDARRRFESEADAAAWLDRLEIYGCDLRHTPSVEALCQHLLQTLPRLDVLLNNACQTVRRPHGFYAHLMELEPGPPMPEDLVHAGHLFPKGRLDQDEQQVDLRTFNSWRMTLADVPTAELLEVHLVNAVAPFVLCARLKPLMAKVETKDAQIVNVSAMEGQFYRRFKTDKHPHTNMAKAALNMLTRTSAIDYIRDGIHMNAVDTGWVTDEDPVDIAEMKQRIHRFHPPLDIVDGAARICDPVFNGEKRWGLFFKDYAPTPW